MIRHTTKIIIDETILTIDHTLQDNPHLTMEEALGVLDKKRCIFFPGEKDNPSDLKSLFALVVWKAYRYKRFSDPMASSREHREFIFKMVHHYLNRGNLNNVEKSLEVKTDGNIRFNPYAIRMAIIAGLIIIIISGLAIAFKQDILKVNNTAVIENILTFQNEMIQYNGYISTDREVSALVNKTIYHVGDLLGEKEKYVLKSIHPKHIVIQNHQNKTDFVVKLKNR